MADAKHTPGPWTVEQDKHRPQIFRVVGPSEIVHGLDGICEPHRGNDRTFGEDEANMRLIAAAPDLLAELDVRVGDLFMLRKAIEAGDPKKELLFRIDDMLRETKLAIAKAGGRS